MENKYFDFLKNKVEKFGIYTAQLFPEHSSLTFAFSRAVEINGSIESFRQLDLIDAYEFDELRRSMKAIILDLKHLFEGRAKWTAERLEDFLGGAPSTYRVVLNSYNDLLSNYFFGETLDFVEVKKDAKKD